MLELHHVSKSFGKTQAVQNVSLELPRGEIIGLFGENGAGKTTLMKCILGLLPHEGTVTLDGEEISHKNIAKLSFATCEHSFFPRLSADAHRDFYAEHCPAFRCKRYDSLMDFFELPHNKALRQLSNGQKNQFEVILALSQGADYILMDEPFAGNDMFNREDFYKVLLGILEDHETVLLSTHLLEEVASFISRTVLLRQGSIIGDMSAEAMDEKGISLTDYVKETYHYQRDRVRRILEEQDDA